MHGDLVAALLVAAEQPARGAVVAAVDVIHRLGERLRVGARRDREPGREIEGGVTVDEGEAFRRQVRDDHLDFVELLQPPGLAREDDEDALRLATGHRDRTDDGAAVGMVNAH